MKVFEIKFSRQAIPVQIIYETDEQLDRLVAWTKNHVYVRWTSKSDELKYTKDYHYTFEAFNEKYMKE